MPAKRLPWFKLWPEAVDHEKIAQLGDPEFRTWITVLARAADQPTRWRFASARHAATTAGRPLRQVKALVAARLLDDCGDSGLWIHDWKQWQERYASDYDGTPPTLPEDSANGGLNAPSTLRNGHTERSDKKRELRRESKDVRDEKEDGSTPPATQAPPKGGARRRRVTEVDSEFKDDLEERYWEALGSREAARDVISDALNHAAATKHGDQRAYLRNWVRSEAEKAVARRRQPMSKMAASRAARPADDRPFEARALCAKCDARESGKDSELCVLCQMREAQIAKGMVVEVSPGVYTAA